MIRVWVLGLFLLVFAACQKSDDPAIINDGQADADDAIITQYIQSNNLTGVARRVNYQTPAADTIGVWYIVQKPGPVATLYNTTSTQVTLGYTGRLLTSGQVFAQTGDFHPSFRLGSVIRGWQVGIPKINKGGIVRLLIPSRYAYGPYEQPRAGIPANSVLDFTIELFDVTN